MDDDIRVYSKEKNVLQKEQFQFCFLIVIENLYKYFILVDV
jgi:hypothetical protein